MTSLEKAHIDAIFGRPASGPDQLTSWDDYAIHQTPATLGAVQPSLPNWGERCYFNAQRADGSLVAILGGGVYPQLGLREHYLCRLDGTRQLNLRVRQHAVAVDDSVATFDFRCEDPMRRWKLNVRGTEPEFEALFEGAREPFLFAPVDVPPDEVDGPFDLFRHFVAVGVLDLGGERGFLSARDRTWGVRSRRARLHNWYVLHLGPHFLTLMHQERADGSIHFSEAALCQEDGAVRPLSVDGHELRFDPETRQLEAGRLRLSGEGIELGLELERVGEAIRLAGAGYNDSQGAGGADGGQEVDAYELGNPAVARDLGRGTLDNPVRALLSGPGIEFEGVGVAETAVARNHVKYGLKLG